MLIPIADGVHLDQNGIEESFLRASGPGGQNVNKVSSAVQLCFELSRKTGVARRLAADGGRRPDITIKHRTQERNGDDALARRVALIGRAAVKGPRT